MVKLVYGVGHNDGKDPSQIDGKATKEYQLWFSMLSRCYADLSFLYAPSYLKCTVSSAFKTYSFFHDWCQQQVGFKQPDFQLDKDILVKGNHVYSESTCVFVPRPLNKLLANCSNKQEDLPTGVCFRNNRYTARLTIFGKQKPLGGFKTLEEAFQAYKTAKEAHVKHMAELYKADIDPRAYAALMAYQVEITD